MFRHLIPAIFVFIVFMSIAAAVATGQREIMALVWGPYVLASIFVAGKRSIKQVLGLPIAFANARRLWGGVSSWIVAVEGFQPNVATVPGQRILPT